MDFISSNLERFWSLTGFANAEWGNIIMLVVGWSFAARQKGSFISLPTVSKFWMYLPVPVAGAAMIIFEVESIYNNIKKFFLKEEKEVQA